MSLYYGVYNGLISARDLQTQNGLFVATVLIGRSIEKRDAPSTQPDSEDLISELNDKEKASKYYKDCRNGIKYVCLIMKTRNIPVRKRKCRRFLYTDRGSRIYTDVSITAFAKELLSEIKERNLEKLLQSILLYNCDSYSIKPMEPSLRDCVQHLFGFQYEELSRNVAQRQDKNSNKSKALKKCLEQMDMVTRDANFPKNCKNS